MLNYEINENQTWPISSDCESVRIRSTWFKTEKRDYVTIGESKYSGTRNIDIIVASYFTVRFYSNNKGTDKGFILNWKCLKWGTWTDVGGGTCKEEIKPQPRYSGMDAEKHIKYRDINGTCSKF